MAKKPGPKKGFTYPDDRKVTCPLCLEEGTSRTFRSKPGLSGHLQFYHSLDRESVSQVMANLDGFGEGKSVADLELTTSVASPSQSNKQLADEVQRLRLLREKRNLEGVAPEPRSPGLFEQAGLPEPTEEVAGIMQKRAIGAEPTNPQTPGWQKLLDPAVLPYVVAAGKGLLGINPAGGSNPISELMSNIDGLIALSSKFGGNIQTLPEAVTIGSVTVPKGMPVSLVEAVIKSQAGDPMQVGWNRMLDVMAPLVGEYTEKLKTERGGISGKPSEPKQILANFPCPKCGAIAKIDVTDFVPGDTFDFSCKACGFEEQGIEAYKPEKPRVTKRQKTPKAKVKAEPPLPESINCVNCGQLISLKDDEGRPLPLGTELTCPICQQTLTLSSDDIPMMAAPVEGEESLSVGERNRRRREGKLT